jgi:hypothetical protein
MTPRESLSADGYVVLRAWFEAAEWQPIVGHIAFLIGLARGLDGEAFYLDEYRASDAALVLEGAKQLPPLHRLIAKLKNDDLIHELRPGGFFTGIAEGGVQVRADMPMDAKWATSLHQDGIYQARSPNGLVFWTPLVPMTEALGPVQILRGSHVEGPLRIYDAGDQGVGRTRSYRTRLVDEKRMRLKYVFDAPILQPGDLLVMDYWTIHGSGENKAKTPRWSALWRVFDYREGVGLGWRRPANFGPQA